jgi:hypothetical protein
MQTFYFRIVSSGPQPQPNKRARSLAERQLVHSTTRFAGKLYKADGKARVCACLQRSRCLSCAKTLKLWRCKTACKMMDGGTLADP